MLKGWDFLLAEIWMLLALAGLIGLCAGWLIWGGRGSRPDKSDADAAELLRLKAELDRAQEQGKVQDGAFLNDVPDMQGGGYFRPVAKPVPAPLTEPIRDSKLASTDFASKPVSTGKSPVRKPESLSAARDGLADDLTKIKGIGPKLEILCNKMGFWHYDQIANWTADEIAWMDNNLEEFKGRVSRDNWVEQAKALAQNQTPTFSRRKD